MTLQRCPWASHTQMEADYHDREWGVPVHDERTLFEFLTLEGAQAGLSWRTVLAKRADYARVFLDYDLQPGSLFLVLRRWRAPAQRATGAERGAGAY